MINLNNYEEYFLLYIDNELSKEQRSAVEAFVQQHPQLAAALDMLQGAKLPVEDAVVFTGKTALYKVADSSINITNYEDYFYLHTDKELSATQETEVEQFVLQHPQLQEEFLLVQQTQLVPENIECPRKQRLYKQPDKRIIPLYITRMAVAAAVVGVVVLAGIFLINNHDNHSQSVLVPQQNQPVQKAALPSKEANSILPENKSSSIVKNNDITVADNEDNPVTKKRMKLVKSGDQKIIVNNSDVSTNDTDELVIAPINLLPGILQSAPPQEVAVADNNTTFKPQQAAALKLLEEVDAKEENATVMYVSNNNANVQPAVYKELNTDEDDQTLYVGSLQLNKAKVNGLFKKAAHLLGGKAKEQNL